MLLLQESQLHPTTEFTLQQAWIPSGEGYEVRDLHIAAGRIAAIGFSLPPTGI
ncbi:MAG: hypothetical protein SNJ85_12375 [Cyanobacteriota bacterium]